MQNPTVFRNGINVKSKLGLRDNCKNIRLVKISGFLGKLHVDLILEKISIRKFKSIIGRSRI